MKIGLLEIYYDYYMTLKHSTICFALLPIETFDNGDTSLFSVGIYEGDFMVEVFFCNWFRRKYERWKDERNA